MICKEKFRAVFSDDLAKLGTGADNKKVPIHRWFPFMPSFSPALITSALESYSPTTRQYCIFDPFIGCGTTAVAGHVLGHKVLGHEANEFMFQISLGKLAYHTDPYAWKKVSLHALSIAKKRWGKTDVTNEIQILKDCFTETSLKQLVALRNVYFSEEIPCEFRSLFFLAVSSLIPRCTFVSIHPYIAWQHRKVANPVFSTYESIIAEICADMISSHSRKTHGGVSEVYHHDSRQRNGAIRSNSVDFIFTSPPYLNNYDYGEATKIYGYFWKLTRDCTDVTEQVRKKLVTSATTYYTSCDYKQMTSAEIIGRDFVNACPKTQKRIDGYASRVKKQIQQGNRGKTFDIMIPLYFKDMFNVMKETLRVLKPGHQIFMVIGDSAPYGIHIPTEDLLINMVQEMGISAQFKCKLRNRGGKWKGLQFRHSLNLRESPC